MHSRKHGRNEQDINLANVESRDDKLDGASQLSERSVKIGRPEARFRPDTLRKNLTTHFSLVGEG